MRVIKEREITEYPWSIVDGEAPLPAGNVVVPLQRYRTEKPQLLTRSSGVNSLGICVDNTTPAADLSDELKHIALVALDCQNFTDGRPFSQARLLREQYGFQGDILVIGDLLRDQLRFMERCGVNVFWIRAGRDLESTLPIFSEISVHYQPAGNSPSLH